MDRRSPYSQPSFAVREQAPLDRYRDSLSITRFLQLFLGAHIACFVLETAQILFVRSGMGMSMFGPGTWLASYIDILAHTSMVVILCLTIALCLWMWRMRENARALGCEDVPPLALLIFGACGLLSLGTSTSVDHFDAQSVQLILSVAALLLGAYGAYTIQQFARASIAPTAWRRRAATPLLRAWLAATAVEGLVPFALMRGYLSGRSEFARYADYALAVYLAAAIVAEGLLIALAAWMGRTQQATHARLIKAGEVPPPVPDTAGGEEGEGPRIDHGNISPRH